MEFQCSVIIIGQVLERQSEARLDLCLFKVHILFNRKSRISIYKASVQRQTISQLRLSMTSLLVFSLLFLSRLGLPFLLLHLLENLQFVFQYFIFLLVSVQLSFDPTEVVFNILIGPSTSDRTDWAVRQGPLRKVHCFLTVLLLVTSFFYVWLETDRHEAFCLVALVLPVLDRQLCSVVLIL